MVFRYCYSWSASFDITPSPLLPPLRSLVQGETTFFLLPDPGPVASLLRALALARPLIRAYPGTFSGGMLVGDLEFPLAAPPTSLPFRPAR